MACPLFFSQVFPCFCRYIRQPLFFPVKDDSLKSNQREHIMFSGSVYILRFSAFIVAILAVALFLNPPAVSAKESMPSIAEIQKRATQGDAHAQYLLGSLYDIGLRLPRDLKMALKWYRRAAAQGHAEAQFYLGRMYDLGEGVAENNHEALKWYRKAAEQGNVSGQFSLGAMYYTGDGVKIDALFLLATMYFEGDGVQQDYVIAYSWFHISAENGNTVAADHRNEIGKIMTREQRAEGQKLSKRLVIQK